MANSTTYHPSTHRSGPGMQSFKIRLLVDCQPWRFLLPLQNLRMTSKEVLSLCPYPEQKADLGFDLCESLREGSEYKLQIEEDEGFFSEPFVFAELVTKNATTLGWELGFRFISTEAVTNHRNHF